MSDRQKRILYIVHRFWPHLGGSERLFYEFARRSIRDGHLVTAFTTNAWDPESYHKPSKKRLAEGDETHDELHIHRFALRNIPLQFKALGVLSLVPIDAGRLLFGHPNVLLPGYLAEIFIRQPRFDLIVAGVLPHTHLIYPAAWLARRTKVPWICVPLAHTGEVGGSPLRGHLTPPQLRLMSQADAIVTATEAENRVLHHQGFDPSKLHTVGVGVDPAEIDAGSGARFREQFHVRGPVILQISTQTRDKGSTDLVEAMKLLWASGSEATLVLIGQLDDDFENYLLAQGPAVFERTICLGFVDEQTKKDALDACDLFVMASRAESFGIVFLEAWFYGKPVIGARAGGVPYVISHGNDGLLVKFGDVETLADAINSLLADAALRRSMGERGRAKVLDNYTWERVCDRMSKVTERLLRRSAEPTKA